MANRSDATSVRERAEELKRLPPGWGNHGSVPPDPTTMDKAADLAIALASELGGEGYLVPCSDGSVQVEWNDLGWDVELWIQRVAK